MITISPIRPEAEKYHFLKEKEKLKILHVLVKKGDEINNTFYKYLTEYHVSRKTFHVRLEPVFYPILFLMNEDKFIIGVVVLDSIIKLYEWENMTGNDIEFRINDIASIPII